MNVQQRKEESVRGRSYMLVNDQLGSLLVQPNEHGCRSSSEFVLKVFRGYSDDVNPHFLQHTVALKGFTFPRWTVYPQNQRGGK